MKQKKIVAVLMALIFIILAALISWLVYDYTKGASFAGQPMQPVTKYTLNIGTNDPATHTQLVPTEIMKKQIDAICEKHIEGFTAFRASGNWIDTTGTKVEEDTLVYYFYNATEDQMKAIMDEVLENFHQSALVLEKTDANITFYSGNGGE